MSDELLIGGFVAAILFGAVGTIGKVVEEAAVPAKVAQIEAVRSDVARLGCTASEDVLGLAAVWNQKLASARAQNRIIGWQFFVPDRYNNVEPIELPACRTASTEP